MKKSKAVALHEHVPTGWYHESLRKDLLQKIWHTTRFNQIRKVAQKADLVLDIGSADGVFTKVILDATKAKKIIGMDVIKSSVNWAKKHWVRNKKMSFVVGDGHNIKFPDNKFDAVFIMEVLEHVEDPVKVLKETKRVLKKGGYAVFLVPSDNDLFKIIWWLWLNFYPRGWVWKDTHIQSYRGGFLTSFAKKVGFEIEIDKRFNFGMLHLLRVRKK